APFLPYHQPPSTAPGVCAGRCSADQAGQTPAGPRPVPLPAGRYRATVGCLALAAAAKECSAPYAKPTETEAEDPRNVGGLDRRGGRESSRILCLGRPA